MSEPEDLESKDQLEKDIALLDKLLGVEARGPGKGASLPALIRIIEILEPAGGKEVPVFPASYAGASDQSPPVYDLTGVEYGDFEETVRVRNSTARVRQITRAKLCAIDSPQSQANRMEPAFIESPDLRELVPQANATIPRRTDVDGATSVLGLPHRVADFRVRLSDRANEVRLAVTEFAKGNALPLMKMFPTSVLFGFWDSRDQGTKHARVLLSRIDATDVIPCRRHALYSGPYSKDEFGESVLGRDLTKPEADRLSEQGLSAAPSDGLGGVLVMGKIERVSLLSLTDIARVNCATPQQRNDQNDNDKSDAHVRNVPTPDDLTNAARRYLFALAAIAEGYERSKGSHRLRSGCELVAAGTLQFEFRGTQPSDEDGATIKSLYFDHYRLIKIAKQSMTLLEVPATMAPFNVSREKLAESFGVGADQNANNPTASGKQRRGKRQQDSDAPKSTN